MTSSPVTSSPPGKADDGATLLRIGAWLLWGTLLSSLVVYLVVAAMMTGEPAEPLDPIFVSVLGGVALAVGAASLGVGRLIPRWLIRRGTLHPERALSIVAFSTLGLIGWSLAQSVAIYGLVLFFMSNRLLVLAPFFVASAVLMMLTSPRAWRAPLSSGARRAIQ